MKRYLYAVLYSLAVLGVGYALYLITLSVSLSVYEAFMDWFPSYFRDYSPVLEAAEYQSARDTVSLIAVIAALFLSPIIVTKLDNGRDEYIISKTEGFFRIPEVIPMYYKRYAVPDLIASLIATAAISALIIPAEFYIPNEISRWSNFVLDFRDFYIGALFDKQELISGVLSVFILTFIFKLISGLFGLKKWRAAWLTYN